MSTQLLVIFSLMISFGSAFAITVNGQEFSLEAYRSSPSVEYYFFKFRDAAIAELTACTTNCAAVIQKIKDPSGPYQRCTAGKFKKSCPMIDAVIAQKTTSSTVAKTTPSTVSPDPIKRAQLTDSNLERECTVAKEKVRSNNPVVKESVMSNQAGPNDRSATSMVENKAYRQLSELAISACNKQNAQFQIQNMACGPCFVTAGSFVPTVNTDSVEVDSMLDAVKAGNGGIEQFSSIFEKTFGITYREFTDLYCDSVNGSKDRRKDTTQVFRDKFKALSDKGNQIRKSIKACALSNTIEESVDTGDGTADIGRCVSGGKIQRSGLGIQCEDKVLDLKKPRDLVFLNQHPDLIYVYAPGSSSALPGCYNIKSIDPSKLNLEIESLTSGVPAYLPKKYNYLTNNQNLEFRAHVCRSASSKSDDAILNELGNGERSGRGGAVSQ